MDPLHQLLRQINKWRAQCSQHCEGLDETSPQFIRINSVYQAYSNVADAIADMIVQEATNA